MNELADRVEQLEYELGELKTANNVFERTIDHLVDRLNGLETKLETLDAHCNRAIDQYQKRINDLENHTLEH